MSTIFIDLHLKYCILGKDSKTRVQEERVEIWIINNTYISIELIDSKIDD
jgi:hypothetical protein